MGQILTIAAASGVGKTTILLNIIMAYREMNVLFFSYDMSKLEVIERIYEMFNMSPDNADHVTYIDNVTKHIDIIDNTDICIEEIPSYITRMQQENNKKYSIIAYDFIDYIPSKTQCSDTERNNKIAKSLRNISKTTKTVQIMLVQVPKEKGGAGNLPIDQDAPMHSGAITSVSHAVLCAWRPYISSTETRQQDNKMMIRVAKYRSGRAKYDTMLKFIGERYTITNND